jgi:hypothetical protein
MSEQSVTVTYFDDPGSHHTDRTLALAHERAGALGLTHTVVASDSGTSARAALTRFGPQHTVAVVTNPRGLRFPVDKLHDYLPHFEQYKRTLRERGLRTVPCSLSDEVAAELEQGGAIVLRIDWRRVQAFTRSSLGSLDWVGVGVRVGLVIAVWARLCEAIPADQEILTLSGTGFGGGGLDTATVVRTADRFRDFRICEVIARPRIGPPSER